jgi:hypothetical protein
MQAAVAAASAAGRRQNGSEEGRGIGAAAGYLIAKVEEGDCFVAKYAPSNDIGALRILNQFKREV